MIDAASDDLVVVSNREPYSHTRDDGDITVSRSTGGLTTALNDVADALDATWVAWGSGDADFEGSVVDDRYVVTDDEPGVDYSLRRIPLSEAQVDGYYYGYSNQSIWPLSHFETGHVRFGRDHWETYREVNETFADVVARRAETNVWIHDYHLSLMPRYLRDNGATELRLVHFWHIPWPSPDVFAICPQREPILRGLLANDAVGFHIESFRRHFLECVEEFLDGAGVDHEAGQIQYDGRQTETYVVPAGVDAGSIRRTLGDQPDANRPAPLDHRAIDRAGTLAVGVDRLDYVKGIVERLDAIEYVLATYPDLRGELTYLQVGSKTRERIPAYRQYQRTVRDRIESLNETYATADWQPIVSTNGSLSRESVLRTLEAADLCLVSSRRDGLNLVAPEFVAASQSHSGVLLLSEFAGVAESLGSTATLINPFDTEAFGDAIVGAIDTPEETRRKRMEELLTAVQRASLDEWVQTHIDLFETN